MMWAVWFLALLVCLHIYQRLVSRRLRRMLAHLPSCATLPFIGSMHKFIGIRNNLYKAYVDGSKVIEETNMPYVIWVGNKPCVAMCDPVDLKAVSMSNLEKSYIYDLVKEFLGDGLVSAHGTLWKQNIKKLGVAFKPSNVDAFQEIFNKQTRCWIENIKNDVDGGPFDMLHKHLYMTMLVMIAESGLGASVDGVDDKFSTAFLRILEILVFRVVNMHLHYEAVFRLTPVYREYKECVKTVHDMTKKVMKQRIRNMADTGNKDSEKASMKSFLEILLEMRETNSTLTEQQIIYEVTTILMAGHETVSNALNFILIAIGCRPDVQRKMCDEIWQIFGDTGRDVTKEDLSCLCYCEAVIYETLRLYPPVPGCLREVDHDVQLKSCVLPKGAVCGFNIYGSGRSKRIWGPDALDFRPKRWLDPSTAAKSIASFMAFSTGKRVCIGKRYSFNVLKTMLVHFLTNYEVFSDPEKMTLQITALAKPIDGSLIQIRRREREETS